MMPCPVVIAAIMTITLLCGINRATLAAVLDGGIITTSSSASSTLSSVDFAALPCNFTTLASQRSMWASEDDFCSQKLPFNLWIIMKAEGTANDPGAKDVEEHCIQAQELHRLELITPEDWDSSSLDEAHGKVVGETMHTATFAYSGPLDFEAMCADVHIIAVNLVDSMLESRVSPPMRSRHLQMTTSEAVAVHKVTELIEGLQNLGCTRTNGEDTTLCVMSDSFNRKGQASALEASGDLPPVGVVKELPEDDNSPPTDEGSAMIELAYDIASGASYKFNTASIGETAFADDIIVLGGEEGCDVIVDDLSYPYTPAFRDGPIATAVDTVADSGVLYFSSAGNNGYGLRFTGNMECSAAITSMSFETDCDEGVGTLVWNEEATDDRERYFLEIAGPLVVDTVLMLHWDDDDFAARDLNLYVIEENIATGSSQSYNGFSPTSRATATARLSNDSALRYSVAVVQYNSSVEAVEMRLQTFASSSLFGSTNEGGSIFGQACAAKAFSVAAMDWDVATGMDGAYADPETASVTSYSSRGPCVVSTGASLESRKHPVTTAATKLTTSSDGFSVFPGTSASAPVAAAIATLIRAACNPKVVTYSDMMEMLTDYDYTIDVTSDAGGAPETFGVDAGFGIISAEQMLAWVATNCQESCPGLSSPPITVPPTTAPPATAPPTTAPPTTAPPTTAPPTTAPPPTAPPTTVPPSTSPPASTETCSNGIVGVEGLGECCTLGCGTCGGPGCGRRANMAGLNAADCCVTRIRASGVYCEDSGTAPCIITRDPSPTPTPASGLVEAGTRTTVLVNANAFDSRTSGTGCAPIGCVAVNTRDSSLSSRWSCKGDLLDGESCEITFNFEEPQDIVRMDIAFYKGTERTRLLEVEVNGSKNSEVESSGTTDGLENFELDTDEVETLTLKSLGLDRDEWISITEVQFMVLENMAGL
ncbi:unnamed protein product [Ascophyllum nodosum]